MASLLCKKGGDVVNSVRQIIARNIKAKREQRKWSQEKACENCGLSVKAYGELERGKSNPRLSTLQKVIDGFQMTWEELFAGCDQIEMM